MFFILSKNPLTIFSLSGLRGVGGAISGSVAASMTYGIGKAWKEISRQIYTGDLSQEILGNIDFITELFLGVFKKSSGKKYKDLR